MRYEADHLLNSFPISDRLGANSTPVEENIFETKSTAQEESEEDFLNNEADDISFTDTGEPTEDTSSTDSHPKVIVEPFSIEPSAAEQALHDDTMTDSVSTKSFDLDAVRRQNPTKEQTVPHPLAEKGLKRITKDNRYIFDTPRSVKEHSSTFLISNFQPTTFDGTAEYSGTPTTFDEIYNDSVMLTIDYEWPFLKSFFGEIGLKVGSGLMTTNGNGIFERDGTTSAEELSLLMIPNFAGAILRLRWSDDQLLVPYGEVGGGFNLLIEYQNEANQFRVDGAASVYFTGGLALNIGRLSSDSLKILDRDYGVNNILFNLEMRIVEGTSPYNIAYNAFSAGFTFEY
ncbi:MAG: hypothetical protein R2827_11450 [Bdellovibrionales bacterium]